MVSKYAFKLTRIISSHKYVVYYTHEKNQTFRLIGAITPRGWNKPTHPLKFYYSPSWVLDNMLFSKRILSYSELICMRKEQVYYTVNRCFITSVQDKIEKLEEELVLQGL